MRLRTTALAVAGLLLTSLAACSADDDPADPGEAAADTPTAGGDVPTVAETETVPPAEPPHPVSLAALMEADITGDSLTQVAEGASTDAYIQHRVSYRSGELTISGLMNVPRGEGPFPAVVLAHGYIDPAVYQNGQGLRREQDLLAREGFITLHVDYRGHAQSDAASELDQALRLGYTEDVISAVLALREWDGPVDGDRIGLLGRSMGGGVVYNALAVAPGLVDAAIVFAPVSSDAADNFDRWIRGSRPGVEQSIVEEHGAPEDAPDFWEGISARSHFDRVTEPLMIHHGTEDDSCPIAWSEETVAALEAEGKEVTYHVYDGEQHAFGPQWPLSMERSVEFLTENLG